VVEGEWLRSPVTRVIGALANGSTRETATRLGNVPTGGNFGATPLLLRNRQEGQLGAETEPAVATNSALAPVGRRGGPTQCCASTAPPDARQHSAPTQRPKPFCQRGLTHGAEARQGVGPPHPGGKGDPAARLVGSESGG
jgi:hypothetical protein